MKNKKMTREEKKRLLFHKKYVTPDAGRAETSAERRSAKRASQLQKQSARREARVVKYGSDSVGAVASDVNRRFIAAFMALVFALSCLVVGVNFATKADNETVSDPNIVTSKNLSFNSTTGKYDLTLEAYAKGKTVGDTVPLDIALVIDQSGSMATRDMYPTYVATASKNWTVNAATIDAGTTYYYYDSETDTYYPVQAEEGTIYEKVSSNPHIYQMIGGGHDGASLGVNGTPTHFNVPTDYYCLGSDNRIHKVYVITAGVFAMYYAYPYYYLDENDYYASVPEWQNNIYWVAVFDPWNGYDYNKLREKGLGGFGGEQKEYWKTLTNDHRVNFLGQTNMNQAAAKACRCEYSWISNGDEVKNLYLPKDGTNYNRLYYVNESGGKEYIGNQVYTESQTAYTGVLYEVTGKMTRTEALKEAVAQFTEAVAQNAKETGADHKIAMIGFAGNKFPANSSGTTAYGKTIYDYTNTGLFLQNSFKNYQTISSLSQPSTYYINSHYYTANGVSNGIPTGVPVYYSSGSWYRLDNGNQFTGTKYAPSYDDLDATDYQNALVEAYQANDSYTLSTTETTTSGTTVVSTTKESGSNLVNDYLDDAVANYSAYGGTYTSYGVNMANKVFANNTSTFTDSSGQTQDRKRIIIVFTDGEPGANGYSESIAGEALVEGNLAKSGATVYTIGLFPGNITEQVETFMEKLSSEYTVDVNNVYGAEYDSSTWVANNYGCGDLDPDETYYYKDTDNKTYAVTTQYGGLSSLGWWQTQTSNGSKSYTHQYPKTARNDARTINGVSVSTFYDSSGNAVYEENLNKNQTYYTTGTTSQQNENTAIRYEYRWYNSNDKVREPMTSSSDTESINRWQFLELGSSSEGDGNTYYYPVTNSEELSAAFASAFNTIESSVSGTSLDATAILKDVINTTNFTLPNDLTADGVVTVYTSKGSQDTEGGAIGNWTELDDITGDVTVEWGADKKTLSVSGFDYSKNYIAYGKAAIDNDTVANQGRKLIVKISGLTPKETGEALTSNSSAGIYTPDESGGDDTLVASFDSPSLDRFPVTMHVGDEDSTLTFNTKLALAANENVTANFDQIIVNNDSSRATYSNSVSDGSITWGGTVGNNNVIYLEYIRNPSNETKASDYTLGTTITPNDTVSYTYQYALEENGTPQDLPSTQISLGTAAAEKNIYITSEATSKDVVITESTTGTYADTSRAFPITLTLKDKDSNNVFGTYSYELGDGTTGSVTFTNGTGTISLSNGQTATLKALPYNATLTVEPTAATYYTQSVELDSSSDTSKTATINTDGITFNVSYVRQDVTDSGILDNTNPFSKWMFILAGALAVMAIVFAVWQKRKKNLTE